MSPHYRFVKSCSGAAIETSGASPKEMALHDYGVLPLWEVGTNVAVALSGRGRRTTRCPCRRRAAAHAAQ